MGKSKIKIEKIVKDSNRRVTFNKRRIGLLKKAYEISVLCEVDIALIFFAQNGEMTCFEGPRSSIEEVVMKFAKTSQNERKTSHVKKYITNEDGTRGTMPRYIENEEMFQEVATKLYESCPEEKALPEFDRSHQMEIRHPSLLQSMMEIKNIQLLLGVYDLNMSISDLISSNEDAYFLESYVQKQLQRIEDCKVGVAISPGQQLISPVLTSIERENRTHRIRWDFSTKLGAMYSRTTNDQIQPLVLSQFSESTNELLPSGIEVDITSPEFLDIKCVPKIWE